MASSSSPAQLGPLLVGAILLLAGLLVGACDQMTGSSPADTEAPPEADGAALRYSHMPTGTALPSPEEIPLKNGTVQAYEMSQRSPEGIPPKSDGSGADSSGVESPYGCYLASRPYTDSTRFRSVYLYFPTEMVGEAGSDTESFLWGMSVGWNGGEADARYAHCRIPAAPGAQEVATEQLLRVGEEDAAWGVADGNTEGASAKACIQVVFTSTTCVGGGGSFPEEYCGTTSESIIVCGGGDGGGDGGSGGTTDPWFDDPEGGGGGGGDGGSGDGADCQQLLPEPGAECEPIDPCESDNPPSYCAWGVNDNEVCSNDPLKDMEIRATGCAENGTRNQEGGRFGWTRNDGNKKHEGIDLLNEPGDPVFAAEGGMVHSVGQGENDKLGYYVIIKAGSNEFHMYAHLEEEGRLDQFTEDGGCCVNVNTEDRIGDTGPTGNASDDPCDGGPSHVHYEIREGDNYETGDPVNPENHLGTEFDDNGTATSDSCPN